MERSGDRCGASGDERRAVRSDQREGIRRDSPSGYDSGYDSRIRRIRLGYDVDTTWIRRGYDVDTTDTTLLCFKGASKLNGHVLKCPERYPLRFKEYSWNLQNVGVPGDRESPEGPPAARAGSGVPRDKCCGLVPAHLASWPATGPRAHPLGTKCGRAALGQRFGEGPIGP